MGKVKQNKRNDKSAAISDGKSKPKDPDPENSGSSAPKSILKLIEKLSSVSHNERECSCMTLSSLTDQPGALSHLLQAHVVRHLGPLLVDDVVSVQRAALGTLHNLAVDGGRQGGEQMVQQDVMSSLVMLLKRFPESKKMPSDIEMQIDVLSLLSILIQASETVVSIVIKEGLLASLVQQLDPSIHGYKLAVLAAECVLEVLDRTSEDDVNIGYGNILDLLLKCTSSLLETPQQLLHAVLIESLLMCSSSLSETQSSSLQECIMTCAVQVFRYDVDKRLKGIVQAIGSIQKKTEQTETESNQSAEDLPYPIEIKHTALENLLEETMTILSAQEVVIKNITNLVDDAHDDDNDDSSDEDDMEEDPKPNTFGKLLADKGIVRMVFEKTTEMGKDVCESLQYNSQTEATRNRCMQVQQNSLLLTERLVRIVPVVLLGGSTVIDQLYTQLSRYARSLCHRDDVTMLECVLAALGSVLDSLTDLTQTQLDTLQVSDLDYLYTILRKDHSEQNSIPSHCVNILSMMACNCVQQSKWPIVKSIAECLCDIATSDNQTPLVAECLEALMDIFSDDQTNSLLAELGLVAKIKHLGSKLKKMLEAGDLGLNQDVVYAADANLSSFIEYKTKQST